MTKLTDIEIKVNDHTTKIALLEQSFRSTESKLDSITKMLEVISKGLLPKEKTTLQKWGEMARDVRDITLAFSIILVACAVLVKSEWLSLIFK